MLRPRGILRQRGGKVIRCDLVQHIHVVLSSRYVKVTLVQNFQQHSYKQFFHFFSRLLLFLGKESSDTFSEVFWPARMRMLWRDQSCSQLEARKQSYLHLGPLLAMETSRLSYSPGLPEGKLRLQLSAWCDEA